MNKKNQKGLFLFIAHPSSLSCWRAERVLFSLRVPGWRNGRRCGLKIRCPQGRAGSTPALGTITFLTVFTSSINLALGNDLNPKVKMGLRW